MSSFETQLILQYVYIVHNLNARINAKVTMILSGPASMQNNRVPENTTLKPKQTIKANS